MALHDALFVDDARAADFAPRPRIAFQKGKRGRQPALEKARVRVEEQQIGALAARGTDIGRLVVTEIGTREDDLRPRRKIGDIGRAIDRAVVDDEDLSHPLIMPADGSEAFRQVMLRVPVDDDDPGLRAHNANVPSPIAR